MLIDQLKEIFNKNKISEELINIAIQDLTLKLESAVKRGNRHITIPLRYLVPKYPYHHRGRGEFEVLNLSEMIRVQKYFESEGLSWDEKSNGNIIISGWAE